MARVPTRFRTDHARPVQPQRESVSRGESVPRLCHACLARLACLRPDRLDLSGQWHLDAQSRLLADLPSLRSHWYLEDAEESRDASRGGWAETLRALRAERAYWRGLYIPGEGESGSPRIVALGDYCTELDGDPFDGF